MANILIIDDDDASCRTLRLHFRAQGHNVEIAHGVDEGIVSGEQMESPPEVIILDIQMPGRTGIDGLPDFTSHFPNAHIIMITAFHDMESTIQAMQGGADDYIHKPIDIDELDHSITRLLAQRIDEAQMLDTPTTASARSKIVGRSSAMREVFKTIGLVARSPATVLITGESGTGKELVANAIHDAGDHPEGPFVAVNCAAVVETLLESDLFGHEKGAFTGAVTKQAGKFELASGGTIFLDEIGELSPNMQAKLLRVLQEKEFTPVGGKHPVHANARVIAATNINFEEKVKNGEFREDLFYRLQVVTIHLPPLRERKEDLLDLVRNLLERINRELGRNVNQISMEVMNCFQEYDWPGNIRELENLLTKLVALSPGDSITADLLPGNLCMPIPEELIAADTPINESVPTPQPQRSEQALRSLQEVEREHVLRVLDATGWHKGRSCDILGVSRPRLRRLIAQYDLEPPSSTSGTSS